MLQKKSLAIAKKERGSNQDIKVKRMQEFPKRNKLRMTHPQRVKSLEPCKLGRPLRHAL